MSNEKNLLVIADNREPIETLSLAAKWYAVRVGMLPADAPAAMVADMRAMFYAGVVATLGIMERLSHDDVTEQQGQDKMNSIADEAMAFAASEGSDAKPH